MSTATSSKKVAILGTKGFQEAVQAILSTQARFKGVTFVTVDKLSDRPAGCDTIVTLGIPSFIPGTEGVKIIPMGTRSIQDKQAQSDMWTRLRDKDSPCEMLIPDLTSASEHLVLNGQAFQELKIQLADHRIAISEASDESEQLAAYRAAYEFLLGQIA